MNNLKKYLAVVVGVFLTLTISFVPHPTIAKSSLDDFYFKSFEADYYLSKDENNKSILRVKEKLEPVFPDYNQNRGIVRSIPTKYKKYSVNFELDSIYRNGEPANIYKQEVKNNFQVLVIRDQANDSYLHGKNVYEINYRLSNVIGRPNDSELLEFYWDINGTGWNQPFGQVTARLHLDDSVIKDAILDKKACYTGKISSTSQDCVMKFNEETQTLEVTTKARLGIGENLTIALAFQKDSFDYPRASESTKRLVMAGVAATLGFGCALLVIGFFQKNNLKNINPSEKDSYPAEFLPPTDSDIFTDAFIMEKSTEVTAKIIDLAVRHKIQIIESSPEKTTFFNKNSKAYKIKILDVERLTDRERAFLKFIVNSDSLESKDYTINEGGGLSHSEMQSLNNELLKDLKTSDGIYDTEDMKQKNRITVMFCCSVLFFISTIIIGAHWFDEIDLTIYAAIASGVLIIIDVILMGSIADKTFTLKGAKIKTQLLGLKRFISMSENERLEFAQSVQGAERGALNQHGESRVVLYERILPYAILFGLEKSWNKVLEVEYENINQVPTWYIGSSVFNATAFSSSLSSFTSSVNRSYSSSSGSSGGGFSGGGGGGGGGGGA